MDKPDYVFWKNDFKKNIFKPFRVFGATEEKLHIASLENKRSIFWAERDKCHAIPLEVGDMVYYAGKAWEFGGFRYENGEWKVELNAGDMLADMVDFLEKYAFDEEATRVA